MILLYFNKGTNEHVLNICQSLGNYTPTKCEWWGPIAALNKNLLENLNKMLTYLLPRWCGSLLFLLLG